MFMFINLFLGPLLCENLDVRGIPISLGRKLTIALCGMIEKASQVSVVVFPSCLLFLGTFSHSTCTL